MTRACFRTGQLWLAPVPAAVALAITVGAMAGAARRAFDAAGATRLRPAVGA